MIPFKAFAVKPPVLKTGKSWAICMRWNNREHSFTSRIAAIPAEFAKFTFKDGSAVKGSFEDYAHGRVDFDFATGIQVD